MSDGWGPRMQVSSRESFEQTALPQLDALYGVALRLTRNPSAAEDLVQDTIVRAFRFWHTFKAGTSVRAWLFTILRNTFINRYHRTNRQRDVEHDLQAQLGALGPASALPHQPSNIPGPELAVAHKITHERILAALESLPNEYRTAVVLADLEGLAYKEIAEIMDCPIGTVMSRIYRGRKLLHSLLHDQAVELGLIPREPPAESEAVSLLEYRKRGQA